MAEINLLDHSFSTEVLKCLFQDAMRNFGKAKRCFKSMSYDMEQGFIVTDCNDVTWQIMTVAKVQIPTFKVINDKDAKQFCVECNRGIIDRCETCDYLKRI